MQSIPLSEARAHLTETLHKVETSQEPLLISRRGQGTSVLMSLQQYQQLTKPTTSFSLRLQQWRSTYLNDLSQDRDTFPLDEERATSTGREFSW